MRRWMMLLVVGAVAAAAAIVADGAVRTAVWGSEPQALHSTGLNLHPSPTGVPAYAPPASRAEAAVIEAARLIGIPVVRAPQFPAGSPVAFFCASALSDRQFSQCLRGYVASGHRALITSRLARHLGRLPSEFAGRIFILPSERGPAAVLALPQAQVDQLRNFALFPLGLRMEAPPRVSLTLMGRQALLVENHNPYAAGIKLTFLPDKWPTIQCLASQGAELPLMGSTIALQTPPDAVERFRIVAKR